MRLFVMNPNTRRLISVGKPTFKRLKLARNTTVYGFEPASCTMYSGSSKTRMLATSLDATKLLTKK